MGFKRFVYIGLLLASVGMIVAYGGKDVPFWVILTFIFVVVYGLYKFPNKKYFDRQWPTLSPKSINWFEAHGGTKMWFYILFIIIAVAWALLSFWQFL